MVSSFADFRRDLFHQSNRQIGTFGIKVLQMDEKDPFGTWISFRALALVCRTSSSSRSEETARDRNFRENL
jgi:hypothetical protein